MYVGSLNAMSNISLNDSSISSLEALSGYRINGSKSNTPNIETAKIKNTVCQVIVFNNIIATVGPTI